MKLPALEKLFEDKKAEYVALASLMAAAALYRCWDLIKGLADGIPAIGYISYDGVYYVQTARNILAGDGLGWEATIFPVLYPIIVAAASLVTGINNLAFLSQCVSEAAGLLLLWWVYLLVREMYGKKPAFVAVILLIPYPHLVAIAGADTAESLYASLVCLSVLVAYKALKSGSGKDLFLTGLSVGLAYLARPEGFIFFACLFGLVGWKFLKDGGRRTVRCLSIFAAGFLVFALPYIVFLTNSYGRLVISSKLPYESIAMKEKVLGERVPMYEIEGLTGNNRLAWQEYGGISQVVGYFREDPGRFVRAYFDDLLSELPWSVKNSSQLDGYPPVYPLYFWIPAIGGMVLLLKKPETRLAGLLLLCPFANMFVYPVFTKGFWIYHAPYVPLVVILAVGGAVFVMEKIPQRAAWTPVMLALILGWAGYSAYVKFSSRPNEVNTVAIKAIISDESMKAGQWSRENIGTKDAFMMEWSRLVYYVGGRWVPLPAAPPELAVDYGRKNGATYLVEEVVGEGMDQSRFSSVPSLELAYSYNSYCAPYSVFFWRIRPDTCRQGCK